MDKGSAIKFIQSKIGPLVNELDEVISPLFSTEWGRRSSLGALILSGCILFYVIISIFTDWYSNFTVLRLSNVPPASIENNVTLLVAQIPSWHLFGEYGVAEKSARLPITSLQIELTGIIKAKPDDLSRVIISETGKPGKIYQVGDTLESGVKVYEIMENNVVLENGGQLEKLPLRRTPINFQKKFQPGLNKESKESSVKNKKSEVTSERPEEAPVAAPANEEEPDHGGA